MPSRPLVECGVAAHDRYGRASNPGGPEACGPSRGLPTCCLYKDLPAKSSKFGTLRPTVARRPVKRGETLSFAPSSPERENTGAEGVTGCSQAA